MILPIDKLVRAEGNVYERTCAAIRRSMQLSITGDEEVEKNDGKVVSVAIRQILTNTVEYRLENK